MLDAGCWILDAGCWILDAGCWMLDAGYSMLDTEHGRKNAECVVPDGKIWSGGAQAP